jgi:hypothetical protein
MMAFDLPFFCDRVSYLPGRFGNTLFESAAKPVSSRPALVFDSLREPGATFTGDQEIKSSEDRHSRPTPAS